MSKIHSIIEALLQVNDGKFHLIADRYVAHAYGPLVHSVGSVETKEKSRAGKPDSFVQTKEGKWIVCEYTTRNNKDSKFMVKLKNDLERCFDLTDTGIKKSDVAMIVLCSNQRIDLKQAASLKALSKKKGFRLDIVEQTALGLYLETAGKKFAHDYLNIAFDTGQVLAIDDFIAYYQRNNIATPLDIDLVGRESELDHLNKLIRSNDVILVEGVPGVGKTRLVIESVRSFIAKEREKWNSYCIVAKSGTGLTEDLYDYLETNTNYILIIDDANRQMDNLRAAINFQNDFKKGRIKIIMTIRGYMRADILTAFPGKLPAFFKVDILGHDKISQILRLPSVGVALDYTTEDKINTIAKGNARVAIMAALAVRDNGKDCLSDVSQVFHQYFRSFLNDKPVLQDKNVRKVIGLISYFYSIDLDSEEYERMLEVFCITNAEFLSAMRDLQDLELLDFFDDRTMRISDQLLATYFFYSCWVEQNELDFASLLIHFFHSHTHRMRDSFIPVTQSFGEENVVTKIRPQLHGYLNTIATERSQKIDFLRMFGKYFPAQSFLMAKNEIENFRPVKPEDDKDFSALAVMHMHHDVILNLIDPFIDLQDPSKFRIAIDLCFLYAAKSSNTFSSVMAKLKENLAVRENDVISGLTRQTAMLDLLDNKFDTDPMFAAAWFELAPVLAFNRYYPTHVFVKKDDSFVVMEQLSTLKKRCWQKLAVLLYSDFARSEKVLMDYLDSIPDNYREMVEADYENAVAIVLPKLDPLSFAHCAFVNEFLQRMEKAGINIDPSIEVRFNNEVYETCMALSRGHLRRRPVHDRVDIFETDKVIGSEMLRLLDIRNLRDVKCIHRHLETIIRYPYLGKLNIYPDTDLFLSVLMKRDFELGFKALQYFLENGNISGYRPVNVYTEVAKRGNKIRRRYFSMISSLSYQEKDDWMSRYYRNLPEELLDQHTVNAVLDFYATTKERIMLFRNTLDKYETVDRAFYAKLFTVLLKRSETETGFVFELDYHFFQSSPDFCKQYPSVATAVYLFLFEKKQTYDPDGEELLSIYEYDKTSLDKLLQKIKDSRQYSYMNRPVVLTALWEKPDGENAVYEALVSLAAEKSWMIREHAGLLFFARLDKKYIPAAQRVLTRIVQAHSDDIHAINMVLDIARNALPDFYEEIIAVIISENPDFVFFKKMQFNNNHFSSNGNVIWADVKAAELERIKSAIERLPDAYLYLSHIEHLEVYINYEYRDSTRERKLKFMGFR